MLRVVLAAPQIARHDALTIASDYIEGQRRLWSAAVQLQKQAQVEPHCWIEPTGELREGLRVTFEQQPDAEFFLYLEELPC